MYQYIRLISLFLLLAASSNLYAFSKDTLIIMGGNNYPPFEFINDNGEPDGFNVDIIKALMADLEYNYEIRLSNWSDAVDSIENGRCDIIMGMKYSSNPGANIIFSLPICVINENFVTRKYENIRSMEDLTGKDIVVEVRGSGLGRNISDKITVSTNIVESLKKLSQGEHDAVLTSEQFAHYTTSKNKINNLSIGHLGINPLDYSIAVNSNHTKLLGDINLGLRHLKSSGAYDQIYNKWLGIYEKKESKQMIIILVVAFLAVAIILATFVLLLRLQIARATRMLNYSKQEVGIAIDAGKISAWTYSVNDGIIKPLHGHPVGLDTATNIENIYALILPEDVDKYRTAINDLSIGTTQTADVSMRFRFPNTSQYRYIETKMVRVEASKEAPLRIVGTIKEVTEEVEMRLKLEDFRLKSEFIVKTNDIILLEYDTKKHIFIRLTDENDDQQQITYTKDEYMKMVHPEDIENVKTFIQTMDLAQNPKIDAEYRIKYDDSSEYNWYTVNTVAYRYDKDRNIIKYIGLRRNNTKWKDITNDLIILREKAEASNRLKSAFLANMSHEIRTPLNAILGFSELIIDSQDEEEKLTFIDIVKTNNELLLQLINDVLDLSRIEAGYINFSCNTFDFSTYFEEMATSLKIKESANVKFIHDVNHTKLEIYSDKNRISQVITNFVTNAFKFTKQGNITLKYDYENEGVKVMVKDTGIGIAQDNLIRVFDRFEKLNDFAQGTGLGLSICKVIIEGLQGKIGVESTLGVGSTFWFWLPCNAIIDVSEVKIEDTNQQADRKKLLTSLEIRTDRKTILVAEDIDANFMIISSLLKDAYNIIRAINGQEAIEKTITFKPDIILMDMKMPVKDGLNATKEIREFNQNVPIIALTAYIFDTNRDDAINAGCNDFMTKPINKELLRGTIDRYTI